MCNVQVSLPHSKDTKLAFLLPKCISIFLTLDFSLFVVVCFEDELVKHCHTVRNIECTLLFLDSLPLSLGTLYKLVDDLTNGEVLEVVFRANILYETIGYCYEWIHKSYALKSKAVPKKNLLNCAWGVLDTCRQSLEGRCLVECFGKRWLCMP